MALLLTNISLVVTVHFVSRCSIFLKLSRILAASLRSPRIRSWLSPSLVLSCAGKWPRGDLGDARQHRRRGRHLLHHRHPHQQHLLPLVSIHFLCFPLPPDPSCITDTSWGHFQASSDVKLAMHLRYLYFYFCHPSYFLDVLTTPGDPLLIFTL